MKLNLKPNINDYIEILEQDETWESKEDIYTFLDYNYKIIGDIDSFIIYYRLNTGVLWLHYCFSSNSSNSFKNKRKMIKNCKELWDLSEKTDSFVMFDTNIEEFSNHSNQIYVANRPFK